MTTATPTAISASGHKDLPRGYWVYVALSWFVWRDLVGPGSPPAADGASLQRALAAVRLVVSRSRVWPAASVTRIFPPENRRPAEVCSRTSTPS